MLSPEYRALFASIRNLGDCPCPRCLVRLENVHQLGMKSDRKHRKTKARIDGPDRRDLIDSARDIIYDMARPVNADRVENLLKNKSYVPTNVCHFVLLNIF